MRRILCSLKILGLTLLATVGTAQAKGPLFFEDVLIAGEAGDFANGALDLEAVYVSEVYPFDPDENVGQDRIMLRIEPRALNDMSSCQVPSSPDSYMTVCMLRVDVHFEIAGKPQHLWAVLDAPGKRACCPIASSNTQAFADGTSIRMSLDRLAMNMLPGTTIEKLYVTSALIAGGQTQAADRAPGDNANLPHDARPELAAIFAPPYTLQGTYEFFTLDVAGGTHRDSVGGQAVEFDVIVAPTAHVVEDTIRFIFDVPSAWSVTPSRGTTGVAPRGLITGLSEGMTAELGVTVSSRDAVNVGDTATILMHVHSSTQGYKMVPLTVRVTGTTIDDPDYVFQLQEAGPLRAGSVGVFKFQVVDGVGTPRTGLPIEVSFAQDGRRHTILPATPDGVGYRVDYVFPAAGTWSLDARVTSLEPSPHGATTVHVAEEASVPGPSWALLLFVALLAVVVKRKTTMRP